MRDWRKYYRWLILFVLLLSVGILLFFAVQMFSNNNSVDQSANELGLHPDRYYQHTPEVKWLDDATESVVKLETYERKKLQETYIEAWYCLNTSIKTQTVYCLEEYFGETLIEKIQKSFSDTKEMRFEQVDLHHVLQLNQMTLDRQIISLSDQSIQLLKYIYSQEGKIISKTDEIISLELILRREDGRWKIIHWVEKEPVDLNQETLRLKEASTKSKLDISKINGINYYPSEFPWKDFWINFDQVNISEDLEKVKALDLNSVRLFVPYEIFGGGHPDENRLQQLQLLLDTCASKKLSVVLTLFDFPVGFDLSNYPAYRKHLRILLNRFKEHEAIVSWNLKNEPDIDYQYYERNHVDDWLAFIVKEAKEIAPSTIFTVGWADAEYADYLAEDLDYVSLHYYKKRDQFKTIMSDLQKRVGDKVILIEEYGHSSYSSFWWPLSSSEKEQALVIKDLRSQLRELDMPSMLWCLYDYKGAHKDVFGWKPWIRKVQTSYGLYNLEGQMKLSGQITQNPSIDISLSLFDRIKSWHFTLLFGLAFGLIFIFWVQRKFTS